MTGSPLSIRRATPDDAAAIAHIHLTTWRSAYRGILPDAYLDALSLHERVQRWEADLRNRSDGEATAIAEREGCAIGFCGIGRAPGSAPGEGRMWISTFYVLPDHQRFGAGRALITWAVDAMRARGARSMELHVMRDNHPARAFYERMGWRDTGQQESHDRGGIPIVELIYRYSPSCSRNDEPPLAP